MANLELTELQDLRSIFESNPGLQIRNNAGEEVFDVAAKLMSRLNEEERLIVGELLENFLVVTDYEDHAMMIARSISSRYHRKDKIVLVPITDEKGGIKSSHSLIYEVQRFVEHGDIGNVILVDHYERAIADYKTHTIILIDDFVGSGSQMRKVCRKLENAQFNISDNLEMQIICLQDSALPRLKKYCNKIFFYEIRRRAISENLGVKAFSRNKALAIYDAIEKNLSMRPYYKRGYNKSEALVSMKRTPNNTLPIFWCKQGRGGTKWPAIFPRKG